MLTLAFPPPYGTGQSFLIPDLRTGLSRHPFTGLNPLPIPAAHVKLPVTSGESVQVCREHPEQSCAVHQESKARLYS